MGFLLFLPFVAAIIGVIIAILGFIGICMVVIGGTGIAMDKIYIKQAQAKNSVPKAFHNTGSIILGAILILLPVGYVLYGIISAVTK
ncbi:hypothetical protein SAMN02745823_03073 [Sporobacter termitidis DSM 10068]|uniref:Uncharacterized protein n=1 Tax=Sporobacter termitidis DSM 10068 TaxID=1123282 RepID=A0A1M5Z186_9FIRM|nr:hypothetical protein [Sporobacter termitidis]SHI17960.1 hypothetical protein SAMN02745823_03073 [Sporobacter termitidis DSM 10068]